MKNIYPDWDRWQKAVVLALVLLGSSFSLRASGLIFITHGWDGLPGYLSGASATVPDWVSDLSVDISAAVNPSLWSVQTYNWSSLGGSWTPEPNGALANAFDIGTSVGTQLFNLHAYDSIQFIAHSAGTSLIQSATTQLRSLGYTGYIQQTFLDAYTPFNSVVNTLGLGANRSEHYYTGGLLDPPYTSSLLPNTQVNRDVTSSKPLLDADPHGWPYKWYNNTVSDPGYAASTGLSGLGFQNSIALQTNAPVTPRTQYTGPLSVSGDLGVSFQATGFNESGNPTGYGLVGVNLADIQLNVAEYTVPIGILPLYRNGQQQIWGDPSIYDNLTLSFANAVDASGTVVNFLGGSVSVSGVNGLIHTLTNLGPTEKDVSVEVPFVSGWTSGFITANANLKLKFDVTLASGANVFMNQSDVTVEKLTVNSGAALIANTNLRVRTDLVNHGLINELGGTIEGNFYNDSHFANGHGTYVTSSLNLQGQLINHGDIWIDGSGGISTARTTNNDGRIVLNGGSLTNNSQFASFGTIELRSGGISSPALFLNFGNFEWTGGSIGGSFYNTSSSFVIKGAGRMSVSYGGVVTNSGTITQEAGSSLRFNDWSYNYFAGSTLNNLAGATYRLEGDSHILNGVSSGAWNSTDGYGHGVFNNAGLLVKASGTGESIIGDQQTFNNSGTVEVRSGSLAILGAGTNDNGHFEFSNGGRLRMAAVYGYNLVGNLTASGDGVFDLASSYLNVGAGTSATIKDFTDGARFLMSGGSLNVSGDSNAQALLTLNLTSAAKVEMTGGSISASAGSVTNTGNFEWTSGQLTGTFNNSGMLIVVSGGDLTMGNSVLNNSGILVLQADSRISYGGYGSATLNNPGTLRQSAGAVIQSGIQFNNTGTVESDGSEMTFASGYTQSSGQLVLRNGGSVTGNLDIQGGELTGTGTVNGSVTLAGTLSPGFSPGSMVINGNLNLQPSAITVLEIAGTLNPGVDYDFVDINGSMLAGGLLQLSLLSGYENFLSPSTVLTIVTANQITGSFANIASGERLTTLDGWGSFQVDYTGGSLIVSNFIAIPEPSSFALLLIGGGLGARLLGRKRRVIQ